ncbi:MAG: hypothetical protein H6Q70_1455 [Firmicutes bacterium]|nr:hypothetical protein [Bacillota bacterium]
MKKFVAFVMFLLFGCMIFSSICQAMGAANISEKKEKNQINEQQDMTAERYVLIYKDDEYNYYLDQVTAKKMNHPYLKEEILDVWLKVENTPKNGYADPVIYTMKHYYVRLKEKQMQMINSVEFNGENPTYSPDETYREKNWKTLVPSSAEESCYLKIVELVNKTEGKTKKK